MTSSDEIRYGRGATVFNLRDTNQSTYWTPPSGQTGDKASFLIGHYFLNYFFVTGPLSKIVLFKKYLFHPYICAQVSSAVSRRSALRIRIPACITRISGATPPFLALLLPPLDVKRVQTANRAG